LYGDRVGGAEECVPLRPKSRLNNYRLTRYDCNIIWGSIMRGGVRGDIVSMLEDHRIFVGCAGIEDMLSEATRLGLGEPVAISAETGML
jgi:hypothetical protein